MSTAYPLPDAAAVDASDVRSPFSVVQGSTDARVVEAILLTDIGVEHIPQAIKNSFRRLAHGVSSRVQNSWDKWVDDRKVAHARRMERLAVAAKSVQRRTVAVAATAVEAYVAIEHTVDTFVQEGAARHHAREAGQPVPGVTPHYVAVDELGIGHVGTIVANSVMRGIDGGCAAVDDIHQDLGEKVEAVQYHARRVHAGCMSVVGFLKGLPALARTTILDVQAMGNAAAIDAQQSLQARIDSGVARARTTLREVDVMSQNVFGKAQTDIQEWVNNNVPSLVFPNGRVISVSSRAEAPARQSGQTLV